MKRLTFVFIGIVIIFLCTMLSSKKTVVEKDYVYNKSKVVKVYN